VFDRRVEGLFALPVYVIASKPAVSDATAKVDLSRLVFLVRELEQELQTVHGSDPILVDHGDGGQLQKEGVEPLVGVELMLETRPFEMCDVPVDLLVFVEKSPRELR